MRSFLLFMPFLCVSLGQGSFDGVCPRKEPPPGVVVVSPGSQLVLTCSGRVKVDGVRVNLTRNSPDANRQETPSDIHLTGQKPTVSTVMSIQRDEKPTPRSFPEARSSVPPEGNRSLTSKETAFTSSPRRVDTSGPLQEDFDWEDEELEAEDDDDGDEEGEDRSRVTRGVKRRPQWMWNRRAVGSGDRDGGKVSFGRSGSSLCLSSVRLTDSGRFSCHYRGTENFSVKVLVAEPPETPSLFCYKKSPSSKIRCEWKPQKTFIKPPNCHLLLSKRDTVRAQLTHLPCSYSSQHSRCWCALSYNDEELRTLHQASLCVTSITGNATSPLLSFTPLDILKPDPPSNVSVQQEEGHPTRMKVTWNLPTSWKQQDRHYALIYEIKYRPVTSSPEYTQTRQIDAWRSYTITDAISGVEYTMQLRAKDEYDGHWSEWTTPTYGRSWKDAVAVMDDLSATVLDLNDLFEGSGSAVEGDPSDTTPEPPEGPHLALGISGIFVLLSIILAANIFRHKDRLLAKLRNVSVIPQLGDASPPPPSAPAAPEGQALVTFAPRRHKEGPQSNAEEEGEQERMEEMHFNNMSYFYLQREG